MVIDAKTAWEFKNKNIPQPKAFENCQFWYKGSDLFLYQDGFLILVSKSVSAVTPANGVQPEELAYAFPVKNSLDADTIKKCIGVFDADRNVLSLKIESSRLYASNERTEDEDFFGFSRYIGKLQHPADGLIINKT